MNEARRYEIARLATAESHARKRYEALGMANVHGQDIEAQEKLGRDYAIARADWLDALAALKEAVERSGAGSPLAQLPRANFLYGHRGQ